jgi:predicted CXXCH cytochrome family protein
MLVVGIVLAALATSVPAAAHLENNDAFCASCHTEPETTFYGRTQASTAADLASKHHGYQDQSTRCIDCHSGAGATGRLQGMTVGFGDLVAYTFHTDQQPAKLTVPIADGNCTKCHADTMANQDFQNHFHHFLPQWQAVDKGAAHCVDCHSAHTTDGDPNLAYLQQQRAEQVCLDCHRVAGVRGD